MRRLLASTALGLALAAPARADMLTTGLGAGPAAVVVAPPCDLITCTAAYGMRKLRTGATKAIRAIRVSDNTQQDIGFVGNNLDEASLLTFCSGTSASIVTFYDQTTGAHDLPSTVGLTICTAGAISAKINNHAVALVPGSYNTYNSSAFAYCTLNTCTYFGVGQIQSGAGTTSCFNSKDLWGSSDFGYFIGVLSTANTACGGSGVNASTATAAYTNGTNVIFALRYSTSDTNKMKFYVNGGTPGTDTNAGGITPSGNPELGCVDGNSGCTVTANSTFAEWIISSGELSLADSNTLGSDQASYWGNGSGISWTTITQ